VVVLRAAGISDAGPIAELYLRSRKQLVAFAPLAHDDDDVRTWIRDTLVPAGGVTVATLEDRIVGMLTISRDEQHGWIDQLYVDPEWIGKGVGSALLEHAMESLGPPIRLYTFQENHRSRHFYERWGFTALAFGDGSGNEERRPDVLYEWTEDPIAPDAQL
jgi:GNAT superfamily N-acetyltransferase